MTVTVTLGDINAFFTLDNHVLALVLADDPDMLDLVYGCLRVTIDSVVYTAAGG